jgi:hypothetical protein
MDAYLWHEYPNLHHYTHPVNTILLCLMSMTVAICHMSTLNFFTTDVIMILPFFEANDSCHL